MMPPNEPSSFVTYGPIAISVLALIVSGLSFWISRLNYQRAVLAERPVASATIRPIAQAGWYRVDLKVENRSPVSQRWTEVEFRRPRGTGAIAERDAYVKKADVNMANALMNPLPQDQVKRTLRIDTLMKQHGGQANMLLGHIKAAEGDTHVRSFVVFVPPSRRSKTLSMRVNLSSVEAVERETVIDIKRTLPQAASTATA
ncbi:hypothetical protein [Bradyrhizobium sp. 144]|uniref:hypothetical protein n=1 Tax=Bradyrhizobium sp. 144 TaxID=2782620 RepID=UPI001FF73FF2|nr:hypothetical protein [Bradyrhizobium sp. 144]MCK1693682.1 hypothetical protein [Bradyrhizobium sp. 144]